MQSVYIVSFMIFILSFLSCNDEESQSMVIDTYIDAYVTDKYGNDLLNPNKSYEKSANLENLKLVYLIDNKEIVYFESNLEAPRGFLLLPPDGQYDKYVLRIFPNSNYVNSISYLKWDELNIDTLSTEISKTNSSTTCIGIALNGKQVWGVNYNNEDKNRRLITIIK